MVDLSSFSTNDLIDEFKTRDDSLLQFISDDLINEVRNRSLESEFTTCVYDVDTNDLIDEVETRGFLVSEVSLSEPEKIIQQYRCGKDWQTAAIEYLYTQTNKVI